MGWCSAGQYFEVVADELIKTNASHETMYQVSKALIKSLLDGDWDTAGETLGEYAEWEPIVDAFRINEIVIHCNNRFEIDGRGYYCDSEQGHDSMHNESWSKQYWQDWAGGWD